MSDWFVDMWTAASEGFKQGLKEAPRMFFAPLTPHVWRYATSKWREGGLLDGAAALFCHGPTLLAEGRLLRSGRSQAGA